MSSEDTALAPPCTHGSGDGGGRPPPPHFFIFMKSFFAPPSLGRGRQSSCFYADVHFLDGVAYSKARYVIDGAHILMKRFHDKVPMKKQLLVAFPGIGPELGALLEAVFRAEWP